MQNLEHLKEYKYLRCKNLYNLNAKKQSQTPKYLISFSINIKLINFLLIIINIIILYKILNLITSPKKNASVKTVNHIFPSKP